MSIVFSNVSKRYGPVQVLDGFSFRLEPGQVAQVVGANGSGKSTLLRIGVGVVRPDSGTVSISGQVRHPHRGEFGTMLGANFVDQRLHADDFVKLRCLLLGVSPTSSSDVFDRLGVPSAVHSKQLKDLSLGMRTRVLLASALVGSPHLLVLDEPFANLDDDGCERLAAELRRLKSEGRGALITSHRDDNADRADIVINVNTGEVEPRTAAGGQI